MKITKTQSYSLVAAVLAVATTVSAHRARVQPFGPELGHKEYLTPASLSPSSWGSSLVGHRANDVFFTGSAADPERVALDFVEQKLTTSDYIVKNAYTSKHNGVTHVYLRQRIDGLEVVNGDINVNVDKHGNVISYGDSFFKGDSQKKSLTIKEWIKKEAESFHEQGRQLSFGGWRHRTQRNQEEFDAPESKATLSPQEALLSFARYLNVEIPRPEDMDIISTNSLRSDKVEVVMTNCPLTENGEVPVAQAYIQTEDGTLELVYDFQVEMKDTDNWFHVQVNAETGKVMQVVDWVSDASYNVYPMGVNDPEDGKRKLLKDPHHPPASPLGWNRQSQNKNFTTTASMRNGSGYNNANFATPPDGQHGKMRMYVWDVTEIARDGDLESGIIIHEYAHGISTRLTGGPSNSGCLGWGEAGGMGEGWGDFFATMFRQKKHHDYESEFDMGSYANGGQGIRRFPYSTSLTTNPETFKVMDGPAYWGVHAKGEVWAEMLFEVYQNLHLRLPFTEEWYTEDKTSYANTLVLQLVVDGLKLQPCTPSFIQARDAIIQAEKILTDGEYHCDIWRAFSKRGLGPKAKVVGANSPFGSVRTESFELPKACDE
ncbi:Fungalysin/Thermolysin Extracellular metalloproteinase 5 [Dissophora ornata]|nr:Fungalysin/Thermolysin Extracellular metalloproteinase 5 [Dissophora ornata]